MISINNLTKKYGKTKILEDVSCSFIDKRISFIMGNNGAGKTTLIKNIVGLEKYSGEILFNSQSITEEAKSEILVIWDDCPFYYNLKGLDNLVLFSYGKKNKSEIKEIASKYLSWETLKSKVKNYSYGQKKKLALILTEIVNPKILIMDEITNGLDFNSLKQLKSNLNIWKKDKLIILTGHHLEFYNNLIDDLFIIKNKSLEKAVGDFSETKLTLEEIYDSQIY